MSTWSSVTSQALEAELHFAVHHTPGAGPRAALTLLHGRNDHPDSWQPLLPTLDDLVLAGTLPPLVVVMPHAPWSAGGHWYVDSAFAGPPRGRAVEAALTRDLVRHVDATYDVVGDRRHRFLGGTSMGAYGALRHLLDHPQTYSGALALSPPAHEPLPPTDSSARRFGAFGRGSQRFAADRWRSTTSLMATFDGSSPVRLFVAAGTEEGRSTGVAAATRVHARAAATDGIESRLLTLRGGHDWGTWHRAAVNGLAFLLAPVVLVESP